MVRVRGVPGRATARHDAEFHFMFVTAGGMTLVCEGDHRLAPGDCCVVPARMPYAIDACTQELEVLEVLLPGAPLTAQA